MHHKFCSNPPNGTIQLKHPKKPTTLREHYLNVAEKVHKLHH